MIVRGVTPEGDAAETFEILGGLADAGEGVLHVFLEADACVLRERLNARVTHPGRRWDQAASEFGMTGVDEMAAAAARQPAGTLMLRSDNGLVFGAKAFVAVARRYGVYNEQGGVSERALFVIDADGNVSEQTWQALESLDHLRNAHARRRELVAVGSVLDVLPSRAQAELETLKNTLIDRRERGGHPRPGCWAGRGRRSWP